MKSALLLLSLSLVMSQAPQTPTLPQAGQRGNVAIPQYTQSAPLSAAVRAPSSTPTDAASATTAQTTSRMTRMGRRAGVGDDVTPSG